MVLVKLLECSILARMELGKAAIGQALRSKPSMFSVEKYERKHVVCTAF